jgi:glycosyltransferase involved in cell wall biosynthesis
VKQIQIADINVSGASIAERNLNPPLVSLIVVNRNYEAFVGDTIQSIRAQDYPSFECFIIDNASTDNSLAVIERHVDGDPRFIVERLSDNRGQLQAALLVFPRLRGEFVVSVDADDFLFPNFLSSHLQVHLALSTSVGFSSSDIVEVDAERMVLTGGRSGFGANCESEQRCLKPGSEALRLSSISDEYYSRLSETTVFVPHWKTQWVWAPGSSNFFRRSALKAALPDTSKILGHAAWDNYFCTIMHIMSGSVLIRQHLSAYRYHDKNSFGTAPRLSAVRSSLRFAERRSAVHRLHVLHTFLSQAEKFTWSLAGDRFWSTLELLAGIENVSPRVYFGSDEVREIFAENMKALVMVFGEREVFDFLLRRAGLVATWRLARKTHGGRLPLPICWMLVTLGLRLKFN